MLTCAILVPEEAPANRIRFVKNMKLIPPCQRLTKRTINFTNFFCEVSRSINFEQPCFFFNHSKKSHNCVEKWPSQLIRESPHSAKPWPTATKNGVPIIIWTLINPSSSSSSSSSTSSWNETNEKKVIKCLKINFLPPFYLITRAWWFQQVARLPGWLPSISVVEFWTFWTSPPPLPPSKTKPEHTVLRWKETKNHRSFSGWHHISITSGTRTCSSVKPVIIIDIDDLAEPDRTWQQQQQSGGPRGSGKLFEMSDMMPLVLRGLFLGCLFFHSFILLFFIIFWLAGRVLG